MLQHRPEIDGLRAVAVLPVILFHAGFAAFSGGFAGVDVFFVISGYLIASILLAELERGNFSIARFYERRARRILPALVVVIAACLPFAWAWMMPSQLVDFGESIVAVSLFASNILFWLEENYFAPSSELKPLLHTWSLAVEEQFYLLFPLFLALIWRRGRGPAFAAVLAIGLVSFALSIILTRHAPSANFYLVPTRAWELMAGAACAFLPAGQLRRWGGAASLAGLALICFAFLAYEEGTPFPGIPALAPVVGTVLVILFAAPGTVTARILSTAPMIGIGLISYSAYLWHQPIFAFARLRGLTEPGAAMMSALVALTLLLAWATWAWVEQPFRRRAASPLPTRRSVFTASAVAVALLAAIGLSGHFSTGFPGRFGPEALRYAAAAQHRPDTACHFDENRALGSHPQPQCRNQNGAGEVSVMLIGDSHSLALSGAVGTSLHEAGVGYYAISHGGCVPLAGFRRLGRGPACADFNDAALKYADQTGITTLMLTGRFPLYLHGERYDNGEGGEEHGEPAPIDLLGAPSSSEQGRQARVLDAYEQRIRELAQRFDVVLVYPIPEAGWNVPSHAFRLAAAEGGQQVIETSYARYRERTAEVNALFDRLAAELPRVHAARVHEALCSAETDLCLNADASGAYYTDDNHLSDRGAQLVAPIVLSAILETHGGRLAAPPRFAERSAR